jgi:hypothetical protein
VEGVPSPCNELLALPVISLPAPNEHMEMGGMGLYVNVQAMAGL